MAITVKHTKVSTIPDGDDSSLIRPSDWNADHQLVGQVPIANGGTGATTANDAFNALAPTQTGNNGKYLTTDGTNTSWATNPLGTVTSVGTGTGLTGGPITTSGTISFSNTAVGTWAATPSSANLAAAVSDETGSGSLVFGTSPTISSPTISGGSINGANIGGSVAGDGTFDILTANVSRLGNSTATYYQASNGLVSTGTYTATPPSDGLVIDYATGFGRFSDFGGDGFQWYNAGVATTKLMELGSTGALNVLGNVTANGVVLTGNTGTVTSVAASAGTGISISGSPITTSGTITITNTGVTSLTGTASQVTVSASTGGVTLSLPSTINVNTTGSAAKWTTARTESLTGDITGSTTVDGSANYSIATTLATVNSNVGTYTKITINGKGLATAGAQASLTDLSSPTASFSFGSQNLTNLLDPVSAQDAATKNYVDSVAQGLDAKASCAVGTTANITLSGLQTIDGYTTLSGDRVLVKNQTTQANNGIYLANASTWTRALDMDTWAEVPGAFVFVENGTNQADTGWVCTSNAGGTIGVTAITFTQFSGAGTYTAGTGLTLTGTQFSITNVGTAGTYGSATQTPVFTTNAQGQVSSVTNTTITPAIGSVTGLGTGVATALAVATGSSGAFVVNGGALGTPSSGTVTNLTGTASININGTVGATTPAAVTATDLVTTSGMYAKGASGATYTDGIIVDYVTGTGRFTVGTADGYSWRNAGPSSPTTLMTLSTTGLLTAGSGTTGGIAGGTF